MTRIDTFTNGSLRFPARDSGPLDGVPVLLLHGWPQDGESWAEVAARLNEAGYRTLAPDLRGVTPTASPAGRSAYRGSALRTDVAAMVDQIGQPVHLVGHDWGAALAWNVACHQPELVRSLNAVSVPHPGAFIRSMATSTQGLASWYMYVFQLPWLPELVLGSQRFMTASLMGTGQSREAAARDARRNGVRGLRRGGLNWYRGAVLEPRDLGSPTSVPVLQVWSDGDKAVMRGSIERSAAYATGPYRLSVFEGVSHWIPDEVPDRLAAELVSHFEEVDQ
ncbi:alpha/beta hydrolase [Nocardioides baekrokdamisoli]|uniref:Alpha/beta hydrolase n=1 Tax=Nocardioides baekrokdamisoli TaxID=1804624 RepID=A0A3G9IWU3_9ACTN|nr:alpha/beta fold hydrolase [Nocardioides baekrokdamisoli]BBH15718.1 alpha/beta hydrolase [Nocardioides baekrokdamisoli]